MLQLRLPTFSRRPARLVLLLGLVAVAVLAVVSWQKEVPPPQPDDHLAGVEQLLAQFDQLVFEGTSREHVRKWVRPIRMVLHGNQADRWRSTVEKHADELREVTGVQIEILGDQYWRGNFYMHFIEQDEISDLVRDYDRWVDKEYLETSIRKARGVAVLIPMTSTDISEAAAMVSVDHPETDVSQTILHEFVHVLGMLFHSGMIEPSVMNLGHSVPELTVNDRIVLRALYDDRIEPDMPRDEALKLARAIITELVAEARAGGVTAGD